MDEFSVWVGLVAGLVLGGTLGVWFGAEWERGSTPQARPLPPLEPSDFRGFFASGKPLELPGRFAPLSQLFDVPGASVPYDEIVALVQARRDVKRDSAQQWVRRNLTLENGFKRVGDSFVWVGQ